MTMGGMKHPKPWTRRERWTFVFAVLLTAVVGATLADFLSHRLTP